MANISQEFGPISSVVFIDLTVDVVKSCNNFMTSNESLIFIKYNHFVFELLKDTCQSAE